MTITKTDRFRAAIERSRKVHHWGEDCTITPRLVKRRFGDGKLLMMLIPLNTRPNYYVVRIGSRWRGKMDTDEFFDHIEDVCAAIEDEYGSTHCSYCGGMRGYSGEPGCEGCRDDTEADGEFPALNLDAGCGWEETKWPRGFNR